MKKTVTTYAALGNNILNKPASVTTYDGTGHQTAQTLYNYDEFPLVATSGVPDHVAVQGARGNVTSTLHWLNTTGGYVTKHQTFDDTGNVVSITDAKGNVTTFVYDDNFTDGVNRNSRAYLTKTILPQTTDSATGAAVNHVSSALFEANAGRVMRTIDQNGNPTDHAYDGMMRMTKTIAPPDASGNRAETDVTFVNPNTIAKTQAVTPPGVMQ